MKAFVFAATMLAATPALAQQYGDPYVPYAPVPLDVNVFSGARIEAQVGYDHLGRAEDDGLDGVSYGGEAGFDIPLGSSMILGGYGGYEGSSAKECVTDVTTRICVKPGRTYTIGGRVGFVVSPSTLLYAKGGYTNTRIEAESSDAAVPVNNFREYQDVDGFHVGGGVEAALGRHAYGKIEYDYTELKGLLTVDQDTGITNRQTVQRHQVKAGLGLRM